MIGTKSGYERDDPSHFGNYHPCHLFITSDTIQYDCPVDVDSGGRPDGHQWSIIVNLDPDAFTSVLELADGWHYLGPTPTSGALDYLRSPAVRGQPWVTGDTEGASVALESVIGDGDRFCIFGEPFGLYRRLSSQQFSSQKCSSRKCVWSPQHSPEPGKRDRRRT